MSKAGNEAGKELKRRTSVELTEKTYDDIFEVMNHHRRDGVRTIRGALEFSVAKVADNIRLTSRPVTELNTRNIGGE